MSLPNHCATGFEPVSPHQGALTKIVPDISRGMEMALEPMNVDQAAADIAAENVRLVLSGVLDDPLPGTLADEVLCEIAWIFAGNHPSDGN